MCILNPSLRGDLVIHRGLVIPQVQGVQLTNMLFVEFRPPGITRPVGGDESGTGVWGMQFPALWMEQFSS